MRAPDVNFAKPPCASLMAFVIAHMQSSAELAPVGFLCWLELLTSLATLQAHIPDLAGHGFLLQASLRRAMTWRVSDDFRTVPVLERNLLAETSLDNKCLF